MFLYQVTYTLYNAEDDYDVESIYVIADDLVDLNDKITAIENETTKLKEISILASTDCILFDNDSPYYSLM